MTPPSRSDGGGSTLRSLENPKVARVGVEGLNALSAAQHQEADAAPTGIDQ